MARISPDVSSWPTLPRGRGRLARTWLDSCIVPLVAFPARAEGGCPGLCRSVFAYLLVRNGVIQENVPVGPETAEQILIKR